MPNNISQFALALIMIVLSVVLLNPTGMYMPGMMVAALMASTLAAFALFAGVIFGESAGDERDVMHRMRAGRIAFLSGALLLVLGIVSEAWNHSVDPWLVYTLVGMILAKFCARIYTDHRE